MHATPSTLALRTARRARPFHVLAAVLLILCAVAVPRRSGAEVSQDSVRVRRLRDYVDRLGAFGFSGQIVVAERGHILLQKAAGWADRRFDVPMTMETRLGIGSVTKAFVAAAVLRLETQGKLSTGDRIGRWLPDVPSDKSGITIAELLCHTGGVRFDVPDISDAAPRDTLVRAILADPLVDRPGGPFHYSNAGFDLLAAIVERASGTSFPEFARRELLAPAGMVATGTAGTPELPDGPAARGYNEWNEISAWTEWPAGWRGRGSGRMVSTALELWRWGEAVQNGRALRAAEWQKMTTRHAVKPDTTTYYGFGLHITHTPGGEPVLLMGGDVDGYYADLRIYPNAQRIIVVTTNAEAFGLGVPCRVIASALSRLAQNQDPPQPPASLPPAEHDPAIGAWQLPTGGRVEVWRENGALRLGARGQDAVNCFEPDAADSTGVRATLARKVETLMRAAERGDSTLAHGVLPASEYEFGLRSVMSLGIMSLPWDPDARRAYVRLEYSDGAKDLVFVWQGERLDDVRFDEGRPFPVLYPAAPIADGGYAAWDLIRQRAIRFSIDTPRGETAALRLTTPRGEVKAKRIR
jgi:CubicO group peptidase (beta-lactamase class C family)